MAEFNEGVERVDRRPRKEAAHHARGREAARRLPRKRPRPGRLRLPNTDPVHKVSIIPRGLAALGYTMQRPEEDRFLMTQGELESRIQVLLAGTVAEEMTFNDISTGAQNDLERATEIARSMVMDFGMSRLGRVNFRESNRSPFLAMASGEETSRHCSETDDPRNRPGSPPLHRRSDRKSPAHPRYAPRRRSKRSPSRLMDVESIDADELKRIIEENSPGPLVVPGTEAPIRLRRPNRSRPKQPQWKRAAKVIAYGAKLTIESFRRFVCGEKFAPTRSSHTPRRTLRILAERLPEQVVREAVGNHE